MQKAYWYHNVRTATSNSDPGYPEKVIIAWGIWTLTVWAFHIKNEAASESCKAGVNSRRCKTCRLMRLAVPTTPPRLSRSSPSLY